MILGATGQLRVGPSGRVYGFDAAGVKAVMESKGVACPVVMDLVMAAEGAIVEAAGSE